ncbi:MAG: hypothetical protein GY803_10195 [Chloroflexi bacterium]|nr:hypothetical protein [Chloroflexota bacterium]
MNNQSIQQELTKIETAIAAQEGLRGTDALPDAQIDAMLTQLRQKKTELTAQLSETPGASYEAKVKGGGAVAQGPGATAVGKRGVNVGGNVGGSIVTGDDNKITNVSGDKIDGDKIGGDKVDGDKTTVGNITDSTGIAIGRKAKSEVTQGVSGAELAALFQPVYQKIDARAKDPKVGKKAIKKQVRKIEKETAQAEPDETKLEKWIGKLANMAPDIVDVMAASLGGPVSGGIAVVKKIIGKVKGESKTAS